MVRVVKSPDDAAARTNCVFLSPIDFPATTAYVIVGDRYPFSARYVTFTLEWIIE
jgi:hypothetical protein